MVVASKCGLTEETGGLSIAPGEITVSNGKDLKHQRPQRFAVDQTVAHPDALHDAVVVPLMDALLAGVPLVEDFEECATAYGLGLAKLAEYATEVPAAAERLGGVVAAAARVAAEAAKAGRKGPQDEKADSKTGPKRETLAAVAASVAKLHAMDAAAVDAAAAGLPEDQKTALASLVAGFR